MKARAKRVYTERILVRTTETQRRAVELEAERQQRGVSAMVRIIIAEWDRERQRRAMEQRP